ncbi:MAG: vanadium-dependent haloperoxidase [Solirubrobacterales bacterium]|nr:vanadium-dependent haloperoxidase [Solirubrobacterales bacterium]
MLRRRAVLVTSVTLLVSLVVAAMASGLGSRHRAAVVTLRLASAPPDQVIQWNEELQKVLVAPGAQPASIHPTRTLAITQIAVYDAVNGILGGGEPLLVHLRGPHGASPDAAAAAAARTALDSLLPSQRPAIDAFYQGSLAQIGSGERVQRGIEFGERVADAVLAARSSDGAGATAPVFTPGSGPGEYQLTPPAFAPAGFTQTAQVTPFVLQRAAQFRPAPPPALTSPRYAEDFSEVHSLGELGSATRTADQTAIGKFWGASPIWIVWNQIADQAAIGLGNGLEQHARLFALLDTTLADGAIALYDAKYAYHRWRPITAITTPDQGNPNTTADPNWVPLANTANDPSYPGAHATFSQAATTVLEDFFGTDVFSFSLTNPAVGITRTFTSFSEASDEASASRIFAGQHFRYDEEAGQTLGGQVADFVVDHALLQAGNLRR